jgi:glycyl-tRNA synthetase
MGKAFRNEVTPRNFTFRSREFEQMELEFFIKPDEVVEAISGRVASASEMACNPSTTINPHSAVHTPRAAPASRGSGVPSQEGPSAENVSARETRALPQSLTCDPQSNWGWEAWHKYWVEERLRFYENIGLPRTTLEECWQKPEELAHYARATVDILFKFPSARRNWKASRRAATST